MGKYAYIEPTGEESREELLELCTYNQTVHYAEVHRLEALFIKLKREVAIERDELEWAREENPTDALTLNLIDNLSNVLEAIDRYAAEANELA